jgi:Animal haem peroxidase
MVAAMRLLRVVLLVLLAVLACAGPVHAQSLTRFGEMYPDLPDFNAPTSQQLADLAQRQLDPNLDARNNCENPVPPVSGCVFSAFTYFGQFIDHDLTLDTSPSPTAPVDVTRITNQRTFRLDLDSVYGGGPSAAPQLYDGSRFRLQESNPNGVRDLARNADGSAILVERRNDENQVLSQIHVAMLKAHNRLVDEGASFAEAQLTLQRHYQAAIVADYLPHILIPGFVENDFSKDDKKQSKLMKDLLKKPDFTPQEFAVAAFRFGHSQVRRAYRLNGTNACQNLQVFSLTDPGASLMGGRQIQAGRQIAWGQFFEEFPEPAGCAGLRNIGRRVDTLISSSLFVLPIPGAEAAGSNVLAFRNMLRAKFYGMPSGQAIAAREGLSVLTPAQLDLGPGMETGTPLWFYVLAEAELTQDGQRLGVLGSRLNAAAFAAVLFRDKAAYVNDNRFRLDPRIAGPDGRMTVSDLFRFAGVA